jgi:uncharacterized protein DUF4192
MDNPNPAFTDDLLAALPAIIGYYPTNSLILVALMPDDDRQDLLGNLMVQDLAHLATEPDDSAQVFLGALGTYPIQKVVGVIVTDHPHEAPDLPLRGRVTEFTTACHSAGHQDIEFVYLPRFSRGATWFGYCHDECRGTLPDPATSASVFSRALGGYQVHENLDAVAALFTRAPESERDRIGLLVAEVAANARAEERAGDVAALRARLGRLDAALGQVREGALPASDEHLADLVGAFASHRIATAMIAVAGQPAGAAAAENLLLHLLRPAPVAEGRQIAGVLAAVSFMRGDGVRARLAAETIDPPAILSSLIMAALLIGSPHTEVTTMLLDHAHSARRALMNDASS